MPGAQDRLEMDRIQNLVVNFGWKVIKHEVTESDIILTLKRKRPALDIELEVGPS